MEGFQEGRDDVMTADAWLDGKFDWDAETPIGEVFGQAVGAASMCWEHPERAGVFDDQAASAIVEALMEWLDNWLTNLDGQTVTTATYAEMIGAEREADQILSVVHPTNEAMIDTLTALAGNLAEEAELARQEAVAAAQARNHGDSEKAWHRNSTAIHQLKAVREVLGILRPS